MSPKRIHGRIAHDLGVAIVRGDHPPGDTLTGEIEFSGRLNVSRTAYREAIRILAAKGLVESRPKTGTRILPRERWNLLDPDVLGWTIEAGPSEQFLRDLFQLRSIIEPAAAAIAAARRGPRELTRLDQALRAMEQHGLHTEEGRAADQEFHKVLLAATKNEALMSLSTTISAAVGLTTAFKHRHHKLPRDPIPEHRALYEAIASGRPEAARAAMEELVELALQDTRVALDLPADGSSVRANKLRFTAPA